jgi:hypothetical protein
MFSTSRSLLVASTLLIAPVGAAMAQQNNPSGNMGSNRSATAAPGTADSKAASGMNTGDINARGTGASNYSGSAMNSTTPGATGKTVVPGSTSSQADSSRGTVNQKSGAGGGESGGGK